MLSEKVIKLSEEIIRLNEELRDQIEKETNGKYGLCVHGYIQLWADPEKSHDLRELEGLVGPITHHYSYAGGHSYDFSLGSAPALVIMPLNTSDSRGESDDVSSNTQA